MQSIVGAYRVYRLWSTIGLEAPKPQAAQALRGCAAGQRWEGKARKPAILLK